MNKAILLIIVSLFVTTTKAQVAALKEPVRLDSTSVVKDSTGRLLAYDEWKNIIASGQYTLRFRKITGSNQTVYFLYPLTEKQKEIREAQLPKPPESKFFKTGEKISSFTADDIAGNGFKLKKLEGKIVVLNFWFIGCPPCRMEIPELDKIAAAYANNPNVVFISFGLDDRYDIKNFIKYVPFTYHIVDNGKMYSDLYRINLYPTNVVLDKEGKVRFHSSGYSPALPYWIKKTIEECK